MNLGLGVAVQGRELLVQPRLRDWSTCPQQYSSPAERHRKQERSKSDGLHPWLGCQGYV